MALPLQNVRVLDLTNGFGDTATRFLADLGAEVVRIELPGGRRPDRRSRSAAE